MVQVQRTTFYRIDDIPEEVARSFDAAAGRVSKAASVAGEGRVSQTAALVALLRAVDLQDAVVAGQALASSRPPGEKTVHRGIHVPIEIKERVAEAAKAKGVKLGAVGRLALLARLSRFDETIKTGLIAERAAEEKTETREVAPA